MPLLLQCLNHPFFLLGLMDKGFHSWLTHHPLLLHPLELKNETTMSLHSYISDCTHGPLEILYIQLKSLPTPLRTLRVLNQLKLIFHSSSSVILFISLIESSQKSYKVSPLQNSCFQLAHVSWISFKMAEANYKCQSSSTITLQSSLHNVGGAVVCCVPMLTSCGNAPVFNPTGLRYYH